MSHFGNRVAVVLRVAEHDDFGALGTNGCVGHIIKVLIGDVAILPFDFVVPFRPPREYLFSRNIMKVYFELVDIQVIVVFNNAIPIVQFRFIEQGLTRIDIPSPFVADYFAE